jgi:hypothetical protein
MINETREQSGRVYYLRYFCDWLDFVSIAEKVQAGCKGQKYGGMSCGSLNDGEERKRWSGTGSLLEAIRLAHQGWPEGRSEVLELSGKINIEELLSHTQRFSRSLDMAGDEPDIDCFLQGVPENMVTLQEYISSGYGKVLRFFLNRTVSCGVDTRVIIRKGVALCSMIKTMTLLGYAIEVTLTIAIKRGNRNYEVFIPVLHAGDPINMDTLAFMFIHPAVLRRLCFAVAECEPSEIRNHFGFRDDRDYGIPTQPVCVPEGVILFDWEDGLLDEDSQIMPYVVEVLQRVGINVSDT